MMIIQFINFYDGRSIGTQKGTFVPIPNKGDSVVLKDHSGAASFVVKQCNYVVDKDSSDAKVEVYLG